MGKKQGLKKVGKYKVVHTHAKRGNNGRWIVTSPEIPGFLQMGEDLQELVDRAPSLMAKLFELDYGVTVQIVPLENPTPTRAPLLGKSSKPSIAKPIVDYWAAEPIAC